MSEVDLFHRLTEDRLRNRCRWAGPLIAASVLLPYEVIDNQPQFIWSLFGELPPASVLAGLAPVMAGLAILVAGLRTRRDTSLAIIVVASLAAQTLLDKLGQDAAAWGMLPLPGSFAGRAFMAILALALTAAGSNLSARKPTRRASRMALGGGVGCALAFYLWPGRGEAPGLTVARNLSALPDMPTMHFQLGLITLVTVALWPAITALIGLVHLRRPAARPNSFMGLVAVFGFPLVLMMLLFTWYIRSSPGAAVFGALGEAARLTAVLGLWAAALEVLFQSLLGDRPQAMPVGWPWTRTAGMAAAGLLVLGALQAWLARPPDKGLEAWTLGEATPEADALFGERVVAWSDERVLWDREVRHDSSARAFLEVKSRAEDMTRAATAIDPELGQSMRALARAAHGLDTPSRAWYQRVAEVNAATRAASLPYYLDPRVSIRKTKDGIRRRLLIDSYRVERVRRFAVDGDPHAVLHVRVFGPRRSGHRMGLLGFSRDQQPFALVVTAETEGHLDELKDFVRTEPPSCGVAFDAERDRAMHTCGAMVKQQLEADPEAVATAVTAKVERHELQHQIDGPLLPLAAPVLRKLGAYADEVKERVNRELSAYVAQCTMKQGSPKLALVIPLRFALLQDRGVYHHAAVLLFEALVGRMLRLDTARVDASAMGHAYDELMALDDETLRMRARAAYEELFDDPLPSVEALPE